MKIEIPKKLSKNHNISSESELAFVWRYIWFFLFLLISLYALLHIVAFIAIHFISIDKEIEWFWASTHILTDDSQDIPDILKERYKDIKYNISIIDLDGEENAFAALGWNIYLTKDLLENIQTYEALDMIVWHEVAHIENRDVLKSLITNIPITVIASLIWTQWVLLSDNVIINNFSKRQETIADKHGIDFVYKLNGHVWCSLSYFHEHNSTLWNIAEIFSTHPVTELRIQRLNTYIQDKWYKIWECSEFKYSLD